MFSLLVRLAWEENMKKEKNTTASREDYLEAILVLQQKKGMVRSVDVAQHLHDISEQSFQKLKRWKELGHPEETNGD